MITYQCDHLEYRDGRPYCAFMNEYLSSDEVCNAIDDIDSDACINYYHITS
jgi:hypothetical protein